MYNFLFFLNIFPVPECQNIKKMRGVTGTKFNLLLGGGGGGGGGMEVMFYCRSYYIDPYRPPNCLEY